MRVELRLTGYEDGESVKSYEYMESVDYEYGHLQEKMKETLCNLLLAIKMHDLGDSTSMLDSIWWAFGAALKEFLDMEKEEIELYTNYNQLKKMLGIYRGINDNGGIEAYKDEQSSSH